MTGRLWGIRKSVVAVALVALVVTLASACGSASASSPLPSSTQQGGWAGGQLVHPLPRPSFTLTDDNGQPYNFGTETSGRLTLLYFGYTHCPDICPLNMANTAAALRDLPSNIRSQIIVVFVTTDPARDTPAVLHAWLAHYDPSFIGLTGTLPQVEMAQAAAQVPASAIESTGSASYVVDHAGFVIAYTSDNMAHMTYPEGVSPTGEAQDLVRLSRGWQ